MTVELEIDRDGAVVSMRRKAASFEDDALWSCLVGALGAARFEPRGQGRHRFELPVLLRAREDVSGNVE